MAPAARKDREKEREKERRTLCVGCKKKFNKSDSCVICGMCNYWYHKACAGMSDDVFKCVENHWNENKSTFWSCQPCAAYSKGITARLREMEGRLEEVEKNQEEHGERVERVERKVEKLGSDLQERDDKVDERLDRKDRALYEEMRERELRKKNVVFYGIGELQAERATWQERVEWDRRSCGNIFAALDLDLTVEAIKFVKRLGEKGEQPRPMLAGFYTEIEKSTLLRNAMKLEKTKYKEVNVVPDLTKRQREEETSLKNEAERRNKNLPESDKTKNLHWVVAGARGEKRLAKVLKDQERMSRWGGRRESGGGRPLTGANRKEQARNTRSKRDSEKGTTSGAENGATSVTENGATSGAESETEMETAEEDTDEEREAEEWTGARKKTKKRKERSVEAEAEGPPEKR